MPRKNVKAKRMEFHCHTPNLLQEILSNPGTEALTKPIQILGRILFEVADRAAELNDVKLNALMLKLTLYDLGDPDNENYIYWKDYLDKYTEEESK